MRSTAAAGVGAGVTVEASGLFGWGADGSSELKLVAHLPDFAGVVVFVQAHPLQMLTLCPG